MRVYLFDIGITALYTSCLDKHGVVFKYSTV